MINRLRCLVCLFAVFALLLPLSACNAAPSAQEKAKTDAVLKRNVEKIIHDYLIENPEVIVEAMQALEKKRQAAEKAEAQHAIGKNHEKLVNDPTSPVMGNPKGDVTIVEFFDYRCGYCRRVAPTVDRALKKDSGLRLVLKEFPILGPASTTAAHAALAAHAQGKYAEMHNALMKANFSDEAGVLKVAASVGLDVEKLKKDMKSPEIEKIIQRNHELARELHIRGTPAFVIGDQLYPGALSAAVLDHLIQLVRNK